MIFKYIFVFFFFTFRHYTKILNLDMNEFYMGYLCFL